MSNGLGWVNDLKYEYLDSTLMSIEMEYYKGGLYLNIQTLLRMAKANRFLSFFY